MNKVNIFQRKRYVNMKANKGIEACRFQIIGHINESGLAKLIIIVTTPPYVLNNQNTTNNTKAI
jgi:hypothetical protein